MLAALADLQQRAEASPVVGRQGAGADEVAWLKIAAAATVMRDDLRYAPVHRDVGRAARENMRSKLLSAHFLGR